MHRIKLEDFDQLKDQNNSIQQLRIRQIKMYTSLMISRGNLNSLLKYNKNSL